MKTVADKLTAAVEIINNFEGIEISDINEALHAIFPETTFTVRELPAQPGGELIKCEQLSAVKLARARGIPLDDEKVFGEEISEKKTNEIHSL